MWLNVGGVHYCTSRMTLLGGGGASFFSALVGVTGLSLRGAGSYAPASRVASAPGAPFAPGSSLVPSAAGRRRKRSAADAGGADDDDDPAEAPQPLFIDRNGALFAPILEFLRCARRAHALRGCVRVRRALSLSFASLTRASRGAAPARSLPRCRTTARRWWTWARRRRITSSSRSRRTWRTGCACWARPWRRSGASSCRARRGRPAAPSWRLTCPTAAKSLSRAWCAAVARCVRLRSQFLTRFSRATRAGAPAQRLDGGQGV